MRFNQSTGLRMITMNAPSISKVATSLFTPRESRYDDTVKLGWLDRYWARVLVASLLVEMLSRTRDHTKRRRLFKLTRYFLPKTNRCYKGHVLKVDENGYIDNPHFCQRCR